MGLPKPVMMIELARKAWVVSIGHRYQNGKFVEFRFFYVGIPPSNPPWTLCAGTLVRELIYGE